MTREEAIEVLQSGAKYDYDGGAEKLCEAYDMAIEALKAIPCEDAVSRQAVLKALREVSLTAENELELEFAAKQVITGLPPVTPKPKTGKWINTTCSNCGYMATFSECDDAFDLSRFCPNCGAKMEGESE